MFGLTVFIVSACIVVIVGLGVIALEVWSTLLKLRRRFSPSFSASSVNLSGSSCKHPLLPSSSVGL